MVIQRWQTLLLLVAAVMMGLFSFCTLGHIKGSELSVSFTALGMYVDGNGAEHVHVSTLYLFIISLVGMLLPLIGIFRYKHLKAQNKICMISIALIIAAAASVWLTAKYAVIPGSSGISWSGMAITPFIAVSALICAMRCIRADIKKLAGYDRLR